MIIGSILSDILVWNKPRELTPFGFRGFSKCSRYPSYACSRNSPFAVRIMTQWRGKDTVPTKPQKMAEVVLMLKNMVMRSKK